MSAPKVSAVAAAEAVILGMQFQASAVELLRDYSPAELRKHLQVFVRRLHIVARKR
jgi:hypothetical protein